MTRDTRGLLVALSLSPAGRCGLRRLLLAALPSTLHRSLYLSARVTWGRREVLWWSRLGRGACLCVVDPSTGCR